MRSRYDDSVVRVLDFDKGETAIQFIRRARGYAPLPLSSAVLRTAEPPAAAEGAPEGASEGTGAPSATRRSAARTSESGFADSEGSSCAPLLHASNEPASQAFRNGVQTVAEGAPIPSDAPSSAGTGSLVEPGNNVVFATGPEQKNTFCLLGNGRAFVSQHMGDMENVPTYDSWLDSKRIYEHLFDLHPTLVACDMHPEYLTSKWAAGQSLPVVKVQHHHAHIASAMAENGLEGPVVGFAFDGTGFGPDGAIWGGEVLLANLDTYERLANFAYFPLPGAAAAIKHPMRCAYGVLWSFDLLDHPAASCLLEALGDEADICQRMIDQDINTPYTSSVGRLFDAASALLGLCSEALYEGEPAILLGSAVLANGGEADAAGGAPEGAPGDGSASAAPLLEESESRFADSDSSSCAPLLHASNEPASQANRDGV
ncbi:MAG: carbamoyltransferase HypF, partial [Eggerthellaceae bacterium]|nr:carbamoyltransferase HypF [Eggerthellaceae bacterium]